jgi:hypothetical protein
MADEYILQIKTIGVSRDPGRADSHETASPVLCYIEVDQGLSDRIGQLLTLIEQYGLNCVVVADTSPHWRFPANCIRRPINTSRTLLTVSKRFVWWCVEQADGFADVETSRVPIETLLGSKKSPTKSAQFVTSRWHATKQFREIEGMERMLEHLEDLEIGLYDVAEGMKKLTAPQAEFLGPYFAQLVGDSASKLEAIELEREALESKMDSRSLVFCKSITGCGLDDEFAELDHLGALVKLQIETVHLNTDDKSMLIYGRKYRKDGSPGKQQAMISVDVAAMLDV